MKYQKGFTVIEIIIVLLFVSVGAWVFFSQKATIDATERDTDRKIAINAMYYNLEELFYEKKGYYPQTISSKSLRAMDPQLFYDQNGVKLGEPGGEYRYEPIGCDNNNQCTGYKLRVQLEREAEFIKNSRRSKKAE